MQRDDIGLMTQTVQKNKMIELVWSRDEAAADLVQSKLQHHHALLESLLKDAITRHFGNERWSVEDVAGRVKIDTLSDNMEVFSMDGVELLRFSPRKLVHRG